MPTKTETSLPAKRFPLMFDVDAAPKWCPLPADLPLFLRAHVKSNPARWFILDLFQGLDFGGGSSLVELGDVKASSRTGMTRQGIQDVRDDREFKALVRVAPGARKGFVDAKEVRHPDGITTVYDLHKLMLKYNTWLAGKPEASEVLAFGKTKREHIMT